MLTKVVMIDSKIDAAFPIECDITLQGLNVSLKLPAIETELVIPIEKIGALLNDDLHG